ncbi:hypothetical protein PLESTF_001902700 [Pleodorina starrii]|nr:hypothetical protein PLESTF_001902700 [Pleodorina starrii]
MRSANARRPVGGRVRCIGVFGSGAAPPKVLLTREAGKNDELRDALTKKGYQCMELPLIEHTDGPNRALLPGLLAAAADGYEWVALTSPESASVFLAGCEQAGRPRLSPAPPQATPRSRIAVVGGGTGDVLLQAGITPDYVPSKALGKVMGSELPRMPGGSGLVLYPASAKAFTDLQDSLKRQDSKCTESTLTTRALSMASGSGGAGGGGGNHRAAGAAAAAQSPSPYRRWWLHRVDLQTGTCVLLCNAVGPPPAAAATVSMSNGCGTPPLYHDDAVVMTDDTLPYIYVYGALQHGRCAAALGGGSFAPSLHRVRLGGDDGGGAVGAFGVSRLHAARAALGAASGGAVTLLGGVRNGRRGVEAQLQLVLPATATAGAAKGPTAASRVCAGASAGAGDDPAVATAAGVARCRRVIAEQLRRVAPREVRFAHPSTAPQGKENHGGSGGGGGGGGGRGPRPCVALAAALSLYSRSGLFDEFFEDLDDGEEERGSPVCNRSSGGGGNASGRGMTLPGHDPLAVAAVVAWVMGRTHVRGDWEPRFLAQMFRVAHCWELVPLQLELVALVARAAPTMRVEQLPAALGLWGELRRLGALAAQAAAAPAGGGGRREGDRVEAVLRSRLHKMSRMKTAGGGCRCRTAASVQHHPPLRPKRSRRRVLLVQPRPSAGQSDEAAAATAAAGPDSCSGSGGGGGGRSGGEQRKDSTEKGASEGGSELTGTAAAVGLAGQLCGYLWGELLRNVRPHTALEVLQALVSGPDTTCCEVQQFVQKQAYCKLATMAPAQRLQLPPSFRTPGHPDFEALREAAAATDECSSYEERRPLSTQPQQPGLPEGATTTTGAGATSAGGGCGGFGGGGGTPSGAPPLPLPEVVAAALRSGQRLSRQCNEWHQGKQEQILAARGTSAATAEVSSSRCSNSSSDKQQ